MAVIRKKEKRVPPAISTSSLPDIIYMLLFFFMVTTEMREVTLYVQVQLPAASEVQKLEKKSLISFIYVGPPTKMMQAKFGDSPRIQLNGSYQAVESVVDFIAAERDKLSEADRNQMTVSLKSDKGVRMGIINDLKQQLRRANALKLSYTGLKAMKK